MSNWVHIALTYPATRFSVENHQFLVSVWLGFDKGTEIAAGVLRLLGKSEWSSPPGMVESSVLCCVSMRSGFFCGCCKMCHAIADLSWLFLTV